MTSDEKAAGKRPSATDNSPCPPAWLTKASVRSTPQPDAAFGISRGSNAQATQKSTTAVIRLSSNVTRAAPLRPRAAPTARK